MFLQRTSASPPQRRDRKSKSLWVRQHRKSEQQLLEPKCRNALGAKWLAWPGVT